MFLLCLSYTMLVCCGVPPCKSLCISIVASKSPYSRRSLGFVHSAKYYVRTYVEILTAHSPPRKQGKFHKILRAQCEEPPGHLWAFAFLLVLEEHERVLPGLPAHSFHPSLQLRVAIIGASQPQIAPIRRRNEGDLEIVFRFGNAQYRSMVAQ